MDKIGALMLEKIAFAIGGFGIGVFVSFVLLERYYQGLTKVADMLEEFKSEGHDDKWLK